MDAPARLKSIVQAHHLKGLRALDGIGDQPFWAIGAPGIQAFDIWKSFRDASVETGYWPVIFGPCGGSPIDVDKALEDIVEGIESIRDLSDAQLQLHQQRRTPAESLKAAREIPFEKWAEQRLDPEFHVQDNLRKARYFDGIENAGVMAKFHREAAERWREQKKREFDPKDYTLPPEKNQNPPQHELRSVRCFDVGQMKTLIADTVAILLVPTRCGWEVPAYTFYSTAEGGLAPQVHVAALKWLFDQFGAELVGMDSRTLEVVPRIRPNELTAALRAAFYLTTYSHCPATSENEIASTEEWAAYLTESEYWTFCWP